MAPPPRSTRCATSAGQRSDLVASRSVLPAARTGASRRSAFSSSAARLLQALLKKLDNGDHVLTESEVLRATNGRYYKVRYGKDGKPLQITGKDGKPMTPPRPSVDTATMEALLAAVRRGKSAADRS